MVAVTLNVRRSGGCFGPDPSVINALWRSAILSQHRYRDDVSAVLARYEDVGAEGEFYADDEVLEALGVDLDALATCLDSGTITGARIEGLLAQLKSHDITVEQFNDTVSLTLIPSDVELPLVDRLTAAVHMPSVLEAARMHPDDHLDRALHAKGLCSCHVEFVA